MTTISFFARGDGSSANNAALNVENPSQQPTVLLTFDSGTSGDIQLDANGGAPDPDTTVIIDGVSYNFTVELTGELPFGSNKVPDELEGLEVVVISAVIDGSVERFFFVTDGSGTLQLMDQFGNGAIALTNTNFSPTTVLICFCSATDILTPGGYRKVEDLQAGDKVLNERHETTRILWIAKSTVAREDMVNDPGLRPVRIRANALGPGLPHKDLLMSGQHRVVLAGPEVELLFATPKVLVPARHLVGKMAEQKTPDSQTEFYHILLESHDMLVANGQVSESLQLSRRNFEAMSPEAQASLTTLLSEQGLAAYFERPDSLCSLREHESKVLCALMTASNTDATLTAGRTAA